MFTVRKDVQGVKVENKSIVKSKPLSSSKSNTLQSKPLQTCYRPEKSMKQSIYEGSLFSIMDGFTTNFISPFAIALNAGNTFISILATLPALIASFSQLFVTFLLELYNKRKSWIIWGVFLQAITWLPLAFIPYVFPPEATTARLTTLFIFITLNATFAAIIGPIWTSMMGDIVPENIRGSYFGKRSFILGIVSFLTTFSAGLLLNFLSPTIGTIITFSIMFAIAFLARLGGIYFFTKMEEPELVLKENPRSKDYNFKKFISKITTNEYGVFVMYLCLFGFAVNIASPFFSVYMLKNLHFSYTQFTIIASASIISSFITVLFWGKYSDKYGTKNVMLLTGFLIPLVPLLWIFTTNFKILFIIEMFSGIVWAGFNLSSSNYVYDATDPANRTKNVAYLNILRGLFVFGGAILGGYMTNHLPSLWFASAIPVVFLISFALRLLVTTIFFSKVKEARLVEVRISKSMFHSSIIINPKQAAFQYTHPVKIENTQKTNYCDHNHTQKDNCNYQKIEKTQNQINAEEERKKREEQSIKEGKKWVSQHIKRTQGIDLDQKKTLDNIRKNQGYFDKSNKK